MRARTRRIASVAMIPAVIAATVASDFVGLPGFWRDHAITAGLVSGLALLLIGLAALDSWVEAQDTRRWQTAARLGFKSLARANEEALDDLGFAVTGQRPPFATYTPAWPEAWSARLESHVLPPPVDGSALMATLRDPARITVVEEALVALRLRHRERLALWLPTFVAVRRLAERAEELARFNEVLGDVQGPFADARRRHQSGQVPTDEDGRRCADAVQRAVAEGVRLQTALMHEAGADWFVAAERHTRLVR